MKNILLILLLNLSFLSFSQSSERYVTEVNSGPVATDFYLIKFEVKDFEITKENVSILNNINLKELFEKKYENQDLEIYVEEIHKTIVIYSQVKTDQLMEAHYNHVANFVPLYK